MNHAIENEKFSAIKKGLLEFIVLKIIASKQVYAADILKELDRTKFSTQEGTLYPLLSKMRRKGLVDYLWKESEHGPPRKYYGLTNLGKTELQALENYWSDLNQTVSHIGSHTNE